MDKVRKIELTITPNYVSDWNFQDAVRELIQNGTDQQTLDPKNVFEISYDEQENILQLSNSESTLEINTLLLGCSTKSNNTDTVGQFGEGYKIAALVLNRLGKTFSVYNNSKDEIWISKFEYSEVFNEKVLMFEIIPNHTSNDGLVIEIENVTSDEYNSLYDVWIGMPGAENHKAIETSYGRIFTEKDMRGKIFVNGLAVEKEKNLYFGYDFKPQYITVERDRKSCSTWDMRSTTSKMICEAIDNGDLNIKDFMKIANDGSFHDICNIQYQTYTEKGRKVKDMIISDFDENNHSAIPVGSQSDYDKVKKLGGKPVFVPYEIAQIVSDTTEERMKELAEESWDRDFSVKEKLQQWRDFYESDFSSEAIEQFNKIIEELE